MSGRFGLREEGIKKYRDRAEFLFVYTQEVHPGAPVKSTALGDRVLKLWPTRSWEERRDRAEEFRAVQNVARRVLVDADAPRSVLRLYAGHWGNPLIVIGADGRVALKQEWADLGPVLALLVGRGAGGPG